MLEVQFQSKLKHYELDIDFSVGRELAVLFGPSGSGKTTVLKAIAGIHKPDKGKILVNNQVVYKDHRLFIPPQRRKVGFVFQEYALFPHMDVLANIRYGIKKNQQQELNDHVEQLLEGLNITHLTGQFPKELSGGEKQRVALVRALAQKPEILLMDEPFSALDEQTRMNGHKLIERLKKEWNIPMLLVTHDKQEAEKLGDKVIYLLNGRQTE